MSVIDEATESATREFLTFWLGGEEYGIDILRVQEIRGVDAMTRIANTPSFIRGVIDLRGVIVPIVDMRVKFNFEHADYDQFTVVIILNVLDRIVGMVVDSVSDVVGLTTTQIKSVPQFAAAVGTAYITGIGRIDDRTIILIDIEQLMTSSEMQLVDDARA
jgi:purine-binding chemotaxis protein CheW